MKTGPARPLEPADGVRCPGGAYGEGSGGPSTRGNRRSETDVSMCSNGSDPSRYDDPFPGHSPTFRPGAGPGEDGGGSLVGAFGRHESGDHGVRQGMLHRESP